MPQLRRNVRKCWGFSADRGSGAPGRREIRAAFTKELVLLYIERSQAFIWVPRNIYSQAAASEAGHELFEDKGSWEVVQNGADSGKVRQLTPYLVA